MKRDVSCNRAYLGKRAIVVGAGLGGLSAAGVLPDYFDEIMILDRDELPDEPTRRPGVPQGKHPHVLLAGALKALQDLFPSFGHELMRAGAVPIDAGFDVLSEIPGQDVWPRIKFGWASALFEQSYNIRDGYKIVFTAPNTPEQARAGLMLPAFLLFRALV